jgi:hypothetical protein
MPRMFTAAERDGVRDRVLAMAHEDPRIVAGALIGSVAGGGGDRWSDLDLGFAVAEAASRDDVLADWTATLERELRAVHLFDLPFLSSLYRVFLFPGNLQVDLSFTPESEFGALGPRFELLFGTAIERPHPQPPPARDVFGLGVHHTVRARICVERGRRWQAQYWIAAVRDQALSLACLRRGLDGRYGRGYDELPADVLDRFEPTLVRSTARDELCRALASAIEELLHEADDVRDLASQVEGQLRELASADDLERV